MLNAVEALAMDALFIEGSDYTLDHAVLLGAMPRDELLFQPIATNQRGTPNFDTLRWIWALRLDAEFNETRTFRVSEGGFWRNTCCGTS
jgi:hypothetical protein